MSNIACYNTEPILWASWKVANPGRVVTIIDGHVFDGRQALSRFPDDASAAKALDIAGVAYRILEVPEEA